jgi:flagellar protein FlgJ
MLRVSAGGEMAIENLHAIKGILTEKDDLSAKNLIKETKQLKKNKETEEKLRKVCEDFESYFVNYMFKEMRKTVPKFDLTEETNAKKIYDSMMYESLSKNIARAGGIGIANLLYENLKTEIFSK